MKTGIAGLGFEPWTYIIFVIIVVICNEHVFLAMLR